MDKRKIPKNPSRDRQIAAQVLAGETTTKMAKLHGITKQRVARIVRDVCKRANRGLYVHISREREPTLQDLRLHRTLFVEAIMRLQGA